ncbi:hypothetical protein [Bernardetia sp.]|uniref:hypothetical protein n=1 Tax=Bernardetia sp. TaxID=1937974 RepID=UPI0025C053AE|nr:hypothetical protein [Bernardetia sp.]
MRIHYFFTSVFLFLFIFKVEVSAQNQIIAWQTTSSDERSQKHSVHSYDTQGRLMSVEEPLQDLKTDYIYDTQASLKRLDVYTTEGIVKVNYTYGAEPTITITHPVWGEQKRVSYKDERGKVTEEKIYHNNELVRRILYSYTAFDSLFGREVVNFYEPTKDGKITPTLNFIFSGNKKIANPIHKKYITYFDEETRKRTKHVVFVDDKTPLEETFYSYIKTGYNKDFIEKTHYFNYQTGEQELIWYAYDEKNNLPTFIRTEKRQKENLISYDTQEFIYQKDRLWQIIHQSFVSPLGRMTDKIQPSKSFFSKKVSVYKDARLIRERHYEGETLAKTIDYQYTKTQN